MVHRCDINTQQLRAETNYEYRTTDIDQLWTKKRRGKKRRVKKTTTKQKQKQNKKLFCVHESVLVSSSFFCSLLF